jgi:hypothetical protein
MTNTTAQQAVYHHGDLLKGVTAMTHRIIPLQERFAKCMPSHFTSKDKIAFFWVYYLLILPSYGAMEK